MVFPTKYQKPCHEVSLLQLLSAGTGHGWQPFGQRQCRQDCLTDAIAAGHAIQT